MATDAGVHRLQQALTLVRRGAVFALDLNGMDIGDAGCVILADTFADRVFPTEALLRIDLTRNNISTRGCVVLCSGLQRCRSLLTLNLNDNAIGFGGAEAVAGILPNVAQLQELGLSSNDIGPEGCITVASRLSHVPALSKLDLSGNNIAGDESARALAEGLVSCEELSHLDVGMARWSVNGFDVVGRVLPRLKRLFRLTVSRTQFFLSEAFVQALGEVGSLRELLACRCCDDMDSATQLCDLLSLHLPEQLHRLDLSANNLGATHLAAFTIVLRRGTQLRHLSLAHNTIVKSLYDRFERLPHLAILVVSHCNLRNEGCQSLAIRLPNCPSLVNLSLASNEIGPTGLQTLATEIVRMSLQRLNLTGNNFSDRGCRILEAAVRQCPTLERVILKYTGSSVASVQAVDDAISAFALPPK